MNCVEALNHCYENAVGDELVWQVLDAMAVEVAAGEPLEGFEIEEHHRAYVVDRAGVRSAEDERAESVEDDRHQQGVEIMRSVRREFRQRAAWHRAATRLRAPRRPACAPRSRESHGLRAGHRRSAPTRAGPEDDGPEPPSRDRLRRAGEVRS